MSSLRPQREPTPADQPQRVAVDALWSEGLGLDHHDLRLERTTDGWVTAGSSLRDAVRSVLQGEARAVEQIGSSSVVGLLAKPIIDLAVGISAPGEVAVVRRRLEESGWIYLCDAAENGGHVFVLEACPGVRVAHLHVVDHGGRQWLEYLSLRDLLRRSPEACDRYEAVKVRLIDEVGTDREAYTEAKSEIVQSLLIRLEQSQADPP